jgi:hypothetical protein
MTKLKKTCWGSGKKSADYIGHEIKAVTSSIDNQYNSAILHLNRPW